MPATNGTNGDAFAILNKDAFLFTVSTIFRRDSTGGHRGGTVAGQLFGQWH